MLINERKLILTTQKDLNDLKNCCWNSNGVYGDNIKNVTVPPMHIAATEPRNISGILYFDLFPL